MSTRGANPPDAYGLTGTSWSALNGGNGNISLNTVLLVPNDFQELLEALLKISPRDPADLARLFRLRNDTADGFDAFRREWIRVLQNLSRRGYICEFPLSEIGHEYQEFMI
jgi:hypothetical protein